MLQPSLMLILVPPNKIIVPVNVELIIDIVSILFNHIILSPGFALGW